jgi:signal transduction histidine kinase
MQEASQLVLPGAMGKGHSLSVEAPPKSWVRADAARLRQVLTNILGNAIKYTPEGGSIDLTAAPSRHDGREWLDIVIEDTGPGIRPEEIDRIFEPYYRIAETESEAGSGLGLSIASELIRQMGGNLEVTSEPGSGSKFTVRLLAWRDPSQQPSVRTN